MNTKIILGACMLLSSSLFAQEITEEDSLKTENLFERIAVIPNPTSEILFIRHGEKISSYQLFNMQGQKVQESQNNPQVISLIDEQVGMYFLILEVEGKFKSYKVQKY